jgi:hypothetical protein
VTRRKPYDLLALSEQKWVGVDDESTDLIPGESREGCVDFSFITGVQHRDVQTERERRSPQVAYLGQGQWKLRIGQCCQPAGVGHKQMGKLEPLRRHFLALEGHTGNVAARMVEIGDKSIRNGIATKRTNSNIPGYSSLRDAADRHIKDRVEVFRSFNNSFVMPSVAPQSTIPFAA